MALPLAGPRSTCLVTGASAGIGVELARGLAARGRAVTLVARREERLRALASELTAAHGVRVEAIACDVGDAADRERLATELRERELDVDVLLNNAGFGSAGRFQSLDAARETEMVAVNVAAVVALCGAHLPAMVARGRGAILNVASTAAFQPVPYQATYGATKAFVLSFTEALAGDLHGTGVTATALCPGPVRTEFFDASGFAAAAERTPRFMWTSVEAAAEAGLSGLDRGARSVVPGAVHRAGALSGRLAPRRLLIGLLRRAHPAGR